MEEAIRSVVGALSKIEKVVAIYLFGSRARGEAHAGSDVDVGVVLEQPWFDRLDAPQRARVALDVMERGGRAAPAADLDIVLLDAAHPIAAWEAARGGRLLFCRDSRAVDEFVLRSLGRYDDWLRIHSLQMDAVRKRLGTAEGP